jgi:hypothetical protein
LRKKRIMKTNFLLLALGITIFSCTKKDDPTPPPPVDNGPIGGNFVFTGYTGNTYDTSASGGTTTITVYTTTATNLKGSTAITAASITSKGLMYDYTTTGLTKNVTGSGTTTTILTPTTGSRGGSSSTMSSNYSIATSSGEITVDDAQFLFNPAFVLQPANKKHSYNLTGNVLKITTTYYDAATRHGSVSEATFTK